MQRTTKKTKIIGKETYINRDSGEIMEMDVIEQEERDFNFHKLWLGHIIQALDIIGNQKIKVVNFIMENANKDNLVIGTQREIAKKIGSSTTTVNQTIQALIEADFLTQVQQGVYRINPNVLFKGGRNGRLNILIKYYDERKIGDDNED